MCGAEASHLLLPHFNEMQIVTGPLRIDSEGVMRVADTRITLDILVQAHLDGATPEQIVQAYPVLELADVFAVLGCFLRRQEELAGYLQGRRLEAAQVRSEIEDRTNLRGMRERLEARRSVQGG